MMHAKFHEDVIRCRKVILEMNSIFGMFMESLTLQDTISIHDSMNIPKLNLLLRQKKKY